MFYFTSIEIANFLLKNDEVSQKVVVDFLLEKHMTKQVMEIVKDFVEKCNNGKPWTVEDFASEATFLHFFLISVHFLYVFIIFFIVFSFFFLNFFIFLFFFSFFICLHF